MNAHPNNRENCRAVAGYGPSVQTFGCSSHGLFGWTLGRLEPTVDPGLTVAMARPRHRPLRALKAGGV